MMLWEYSFLRWIIENLQSPFISEIMKVITVAGEGAAIFFLMSFIMLFFKKTRKTGIVSIIALILIAGFNNYAFKYIVARPRPFLHPTLSADALWLNNYVLNVFRPQSAFNDFLVPSSYAFVSGHTLSAFIWGFIVSIYHKKATASALIFSALMAFSRLYLGFHYPTDVIAGILWALVTALAFTYVANYNEEKVVTWWKNRRHQKTK
jgi:undecaprenyl-diphosphatase